MRKLLFGVLLISSLSAQPLDGTRPLTMEGDLASQMLTGMERTLDRLQAESLVIRQKPGTRKRLAYLIGAVDKRVPFERLSFESDNLSKRFQVYSVRWPVLAGFEASGVYLKAAHEPKCGAVVLQDPDGPPMGYEVLAASGCDILMPALVDRGSTGLASPEAGKRTNQPHREFVYRMAYEMGRHVIGYEVQEVLAAVDWFNRRGLKTGVIGYGEGGLVAFYSAALDTRITAAVVGGYFGSKEQIWKEPIYRNVWGLLDGFGDAEVASLVAPRKLWIDTRDYPEWEAPPANQGGAAPGTLGRPVEVEQEIARARVYHPGLVVSAEERPVRALARELSGAEQVHVPQVDWKADPGLSSRNFQQMVDFTQALVRQSTARRKAFTPSARYLDEEILGKLPAPDQPLTASTRLVLDTEKFRAYEVVIPVLKESFAEGMLLVPKNLRAGERRAVVVCQHGLGDHPLDIVAPPTQKAENTYHRYAARLAEEGFVVYAPQNPYIELPRFRQFLRKANPLKLSLFSFIVSQHRRTLDWLETLPFVDPQRIGFYGLSYGGKTAMRVPPLEPRYKAVICSGDFNEWTWKITSVDEPFSYMYTPEYDMLEFNLGNTMAYFEMTTLIAPRPFMVERGHSDSVGIDEWIAYEFAKVRRYYDGKGIGDRTEIEFFSGPHTIHGVGTFEFLRKHLKGL